jgi:hypothetical protein
MNVASELEIKHIHKWLNNKACVDFVNELGFLLRKHNVSLIVDNDYDSEENCIGTDMYFKVGSNKVDSDMIDLLLGHLKLRESFS